MIRKEEKKKFRRVRYIVDTVFQLKYVGFFLLMIFFTAAVCSYTVYYSGMLTIVDKLSGFYPQGRLVAMLNTVNLKIFINILLLVPIIIMIGIYLSHKIAGPVYRLERFLGDMALGNLSSNIRFRKGDELTHIADKLNLVLDSLRATMAVQKDGLEKISREIDSHKGSGSGDSDSPIGRIHKEVMKLKDEINKYRL